VSADVLLRLLGVRVRLLLLLQSAAALHYGN
jgi:hypothetical protein